MTDPKDDSAALKEVGSELDTLIAKLSDPVTPAGKPGSARLNGQHEPSPARSGSLTGRDPQDASSESLPKPGHEDPVNQPSGQPRDDSLPGEVEALSHSYHKALFPGRGRGDKAEPGYGIEQPAPAQTSTSRAPTLIVAALVALVALVIVIGAGILAYRSVVNERIEQLRKSVGLLQQQLTVRDEDIMLIQDTLRGLRQDQETTDHSIRRLGKDISVMQHDTADQVKGLIGKIEKLQRLNAQPAQGSPTADSTNDAITIAIDRTGPEQPGTIDRSVDAEKTTLVVNLPETAAAPDPRNDSQTPDTTKASQSTWVVNLVSHETRSVAMEQAERLRKMDVSAVVSKAVIQGKHWYRVRVEGFSDAKAAEAFRMQYRRQPEFSGAWIAKGN